jgi:predicted nucleotidyltransferase
MIADLAEIRARITPVLVAAGVDFAYLGGSIAKGTAGWWSDVDIFVYKEMLKSLSRTAKMDWFQELDLEIVLVLHTDDVDLKILDDLPIHVQFNAISGGIPVYEVDDGKTLARYIESMLTRYYEQGAWYLQMLAERVRQ